MYRGSMSLQVSIEKNKEYSIALLLIILQEEKVFDRNEHNNSGNLMIYPYHL